MKCASTLREIAVHVLYYYLNSLNYIYMYYKVGQLLFEQSELRFGQLNNGQTTKFQTVFGFDTNNTSPFNLGMQLY